MRFVITEKQIKGHLHFFKTKVFLSSPRSNFSIIRSILNSVAIGYEPVVERNLWIRIRRSTAWRWIRRRAFSICKRFQKRQG